MNELLELIPQVLSTPLKFIKWLESLSHTVYIGDVRDPSDCPLSNFLLYETGYKYYVVFENFALCEDDYREGLAYSFNSEHWTRQFQLLSLNEDILNNRECLNILKKMGFYA